MSETNIPDQDTTEQVEDTTEQVTNIPEQVTNLPFFRIMSKPTRQLSKAEFEDGIGRFMLYAGMLLVTFILLWLLTMINL
ncbi:MAG: hypothetical protein RSC68_00310 [Acinetobacter sp.]